MQTMLFFREPRTLFNCQRLKNSLKWLNNIGTTATPSEGWWCSFNRVEVRGNTLLPTSQMHSFTYAWKEKVLENLGPWAVRTLTHYQSPYMKNVWRMRCKASVKAAETLRRLTACKMRGNGGSSERLMKTSYLTQWYAVENFQWTVK